MPSSENMIMICKVCIEDPNKTGEIRAPFAQTSNLTKHLKSHNDHEKLETWLRQYKESTGSLPKTMISEEDFDLVCYFITSNACLVDIQNRFHKKILKIDVPTIRKLKEKIDHVLKNLYTLIENKVNLIFLI